GVHSPRPVKAPSLSSATTTSASVFAPRLMVNVPAIGQRSRRTESMTDIDATSRGAALSPSPRSLRGEGRGEGTLRASGPNGKPPHPDLLPASGEKEKSDHLFEPAGGVRQHGVDLAGFRREVGARHDLTAVVAGNFVEQPLELADIAVDRLAELAIGLVAP